MFESTRVLFKRGIVPVSSTFLPFPQVLLLIPSLLLFLPRLFLLSLHLSSKHLYSLKAFTALKLSAMRSIILSLVLALSLFSIVFGQVHSDVDSAHSDFKITAWLRSTFSRRTETYKQAIELLSTYDTFPSCHRLAVGALFETCGSAPSVDMDGNHILEDEKNLFAARLAVCELKSANAVIDEVCLGMVPNESSKSSFFPWSSGNAKHTLKSIYEEVDPTQRDACIKSLHSSTQSWTSYSNARQNAVLMCDTARAEINRGIIGLAIPWFIGKTLMSKLEEMLNIYKAVTVFSSVTIKELLKVLEQVHTFFGAVGHFQTKLSEELGLASAQILANITSAMETLGDISREVFVFEWCFRLSS